MRCHDTLLCGIGRRDVISDSTVASIKEGLARGEAPVEVKRFDKSGHLAHLDEREEYVTVRETAQGCVRGRGELVQTSYCYRGFSFLVLAEGVPKWTNRSHRNFGFLYWLGLHPVPVLSIVVVAAVVEVTRYFALAHFFCLALRSLPWLYRRNCCSCSRTTLPPSMTLGREKAATQRSEEACYVNVSTAPQLRHSLAASCRDLDRACCLRLKYVRWGRRRCSGGSGQRTPAFRRFCCTRPSTGW